MHPRTGMLRAILFGSRGLFRHDMLASKRERGRTPFHWMLSPVAHAVAYTRGGALPTVQVAMLYRSTDLVLLTIIRCRVPTLPLLPRAHQLAKWHPIALGAAVLDAVVERTGIDASLIDDVIVGCVSQAGAQAGNIGRNMVLASKHIPESVPGTSVDRQCGSSQQAIHFAAQASEKGNKRKEKETTQPFFPPSFLFPFPPLSRPPIQKMLIRISCNALDGATVNRQPPPGCCFGLPGRGDCRRRRAHVECADRCERRRLF